MDRHKMEYATYVASVDVQFQPITNYLEDVLRKYYQDDVIDTWMGTFWGGTQQVIRGFGLWHYTNRSNQSGTWFEIGYAVQAKYVSVYINAVKDKQYLVQTYKGKLGKVKLGSSNLSIKRLEDLNQDEFETMIEEAVAIMKKSA